MVYGALVCSCGWNSYDVESSAFARTYFATLGKKLCFCWGLHVLSHDTGHRPGKHNIYVKCFMTSTKNFSHGLENTEVCSGQVLL